MPLNVRERAKADPDCRKLIERERDLLWCLALVQCLDPATMVEVTSCFLRLEIDKKAGESIPGSVENP